MQIAFHLGAHATDEDQILKALLQNKGVLSAEGISVPGPGRYRDAIMKLTQKLKGEPITADSEQLLIDSIIDDDSTERVILSHEDFICVPGRVFDNSIFYDRASYKPRWLANLFPSAEPEFFLGIRNPASQIPATYLMKRQKTKGFGAFLNGTDLPALRWSEVAIAIKEAMPDAPLTVWCNEDIPLILPQILREISGCDPNTKLMGGMNVLSKIMAREGMRRLRRYLADNEIHSEQHRRRVVAVFLEKFALEDEVDEELDVPGWDEGVVDALTDIYEEDIQELSRLPGVNFISA